MAKTTTKVVKHEKPMWTNVFLEIMAGSTMSRPVWANAISEAVLVVTKYQTQTAGFYYSLANEAFQKACFHFSIDGNEWNDFEREIVRLRNNVKFEDLGIVLTQGDQVFSVVTEIEEEDDNEEG